MFNADDYNNAEAYEDALKSVPGYFNEASGLLAELSVQIAGVNAVTSFAIKQRALFIAAIIKLMLDQGVYDMNLTQEDYETMNEYGLAVDVAEEPEKLINLHVVFPNQIKKAIE